MRDTQALHHREAMPAELPALRSDAAGVRKRQAQICLRRETFLAYATSVDVHT